MIYKKKINPIHPEKDMIDKIGEEFEQLIE